MPGSTPRDPATEIAGARVVGWLELFYDLVFVAAIVTFSDAVSAHPDGDVIVIVTTAFAGVWWIWLTTTLFANRFKVDDGPQRALILVQMVLLTLLALLVGDGVGRHEGFASLAYGLLCLSVALMHARAVRRPGTLAALARARRDEFALAAIVFVVAALMDGPGRYALLILGFAVIVIPTVARRYGPAHDEVALHEEHLVERLGLLTIMVCGESFVKVSLLATDGRLEELDVIVICALFVLVFSMWWSYFDDVPDAGVPASLSKSRGWLFGHLALQTCLVGVAVGYAKMLRLDLGHNVDFDKMLLAVGPMFGVYLSLALVGACTRRVPVGPLLALRLGSALALVPIAIIVWQVDWVGVDATAILLAVFALAHGGLASVLRRSTHVLPGPEPTPTL
jgi:low temperature requirement protein LtrA